MALWQAQNVADLLTAKGWNTQIITFETTGDLKLDASISKIGSKGVFTAELEEALRLQNIDIAVHSAKDMPSEDSPNLKLLAFTEREAAHDVLVSSKPIVDGQIPANWIIGTSSTRRVAQLKHFYPSLKTQNVRGNLQTRFRKLSEGHCDALMLAFAGVHRMGFAAQIVYEFPIHKIVTSAGQGSLAIQVAEKMPQELQNELFEILNHEHTSVAVLAERAFLKTMQGGCSVPVFVHAELQNSGQYCLMGGVASLDGQQFLSEKTICGRETIQSFAIQMADKLLERGAKQILEEIKQEKS